MQGTLMIYLISLVAFLAASSGVAKHTGRYTVKMAERTGVLWEMVEWDVDNPTYTGNPFDVVAQVTFTHSASGTSHTTEMFYAGGATWKFRFTGTRVGQWRYTSESADPEFAGLSGEVTVSSNPNGQVKGFITTYGNKFARQVGETGEVAGHLLHIYLNETDFRTNGEPYGERLADWQGAAGSRTRAYCAEAQVSGFNTIFIHLNNEWFALGANKHTTHNSVDPDLDTFALLDEILITAQQDGCDVHLWAWGDEARRWTPIGVPGGINGEADQRLQRYIAARLGPLPNWTMAYGFDLEEWVSESQLRVWADYLHAHMGWEHLLMGRNRANASLDVVSNDERPCDGFYDNAVRMLERSGNRPVLYERRFLHTRDCWDMQGTRRALWQFTLAGGAGSFWGINWDDDSPAYPNPEQLQTHARFWQGRFLLDMARATSLSDGYVLKTPANAYFVFYQEGTDAIRMDLSSMTRPAPAIAVDTQTAYAEIDLGILPVADQTWSAPYPSDWAVAVGDFAALPPGTVPPAKPPVNPQEPTRLYLPLVLLVILLPTVLGLWVWSRAWLPFYKLKPKSKMFWSRL